MASLLRETPKEARASQSGSADARLLLLVALAAVIVMTEFPAWADWVLFWVVIGGLIIAGGRWVYRRYGEPGTISLKNVTRESLTTGDSYVAIRADFRRPVAFVKARVVFTDTLRGDRTKHRGDLRITSVSDGSSPSSIDEDFVRLSYALAEIRFADAPLIGGPDDPIIWAVSYSTSQPWSGRIALIGYDEDGHRLIASTRVEIS